MQSKSSTGLLTLENKTNILQLPASFHRTLHLVTHDVNTQGAGFHLDINLLRELSELNAGFHFTWLFRSG